MQRIIAHRGNSSRAPENTLASIAAAAGVAAMTEFDIRVSADGYLVAMHNQTVDQTTSGSGEVALLNYVAGMDQLDAGSWFSPQFAGEPIPTLADSVLLALELGLTPVVERKTGSATVYYEELKAIKALDKVHIISFNWSFLSDFRALCPDIPLGALGYGTITPQIVDSIRSHGACYINWSHGKLDQQQVDLVRNSGMRLAVWTVNTKERMQELLAMGVEAITTDYPEHLYNLVRDMGYAGWASDPAQELEVTNRAFWADPEGTGNPNGIKYVLGTTPDLPGRHHMTGLEVPEQGVFVFHHTINNALANDVVYGYKWSFDLHNWHKAGEASPSGELVTVERFVAKEQSYPLPNLVRVTATVVSGCTSRLFLRLYAKQIDP